MNKFLASIMLLALTSVALLSMVGPASGEQTNVAAQRADCLEQIAQKQQAIEISSEVRERVKEVQPFYEGRKDYMTAPGDLPACKKLKEVFQEATQSQFGCPKESVKGLTRSRIFINMLKEADGETKKKFKGFYACEWGRFASQAMSPTIYEAVTGDSTPVYVESKELFSSDDDTSSTFSDTKYDSDDESRFHDPAEHFDFEQTERSEECYKGVLQSIKNWVSLDDPSLTKLMQDADKYYGYKGEIPEHGSEPLEACDDLLAKHAEVLSTKCFNERPAMGQSLQEDFAELAKNEPSRFFLESVYACGFGRLSGYELKMDGLFDLVAKPYLEEKRAASSEMA